MKPFNEHELLGYYIEYSRSRKEGGSSAKESLVDGCQQIIVSFQSKTHKSDHYSQNYGVALELYASLLTEVSIAEEDPHLKFMS